MSENRGPWYLVTGVILGFVIGLLLAWWVIPVEAENTLPASMRSNFKDDYRYMVSLAYQANNNLPRARARLNLLGDPNLESALGDHAQRMLASNVSLEAVQVLANLSEALRNEQAAAPVLGVTEVRPADSTLEPATTLDTGSPLGLETNTPKGGEAIQLPSATPKNLIAETAVVMPGVETSTPAGTATKAPSATASLPPTATSTPISTATARPSRTPTATPGQPFALTGQSTFCEAARPGWLQIYLEDANGDPVPGVEITITWLGGEEKFFTGLKPDLGNGYADFLMKTGIEYVLSMSNGMVRLTGLKASTCPGDFLGSIKLEFRQP